MNVLISGASIAGPALAYWLHRRGFDVTVVERAPELRRGGYAVDIRGAALAVIDRMGLRERLRPLQTDTVATWFVDARGRRFGRMERGFGVIDPEDIELHRGDLAFVLYEQTRGDVAYRFGDSVAALEPLDPGRDGARRTRVTFASGERREFDAVIGADGVHSRVRSLAFGPEASFLRDMGSAMAIFSAPNDFGLDREQLLLQDVGRVASIKSADANRTLKVCVFYERAAGAFDPRDVAGQKESVRRAFADAGAGFPRLLAAMDSADDFYSDVTCQIHVDRYHAGNVALVGDAAYCPSPLSGQGTSLALVGAYVLGTCMGDSPFDLEAAFARYDATMRGFAGKNQAIALDLATNFAPRTRFQAWMRRALMRLLPYMPWVPWIMRLAMRNIARTARDIVLPAGDGWSDASVEAQISP